MGGMKPWVETRPVRRRYQLPMRVTVRNASDEGEQRMAMARTCDSIVYCYWTSGLFFVGEFIVTLLSGRGQRTRSATGVLRHQIMSARMSRVHGYVSMSTPSFQQFVISLGRWN